MKANVRSALVWSAMAVALAHAGDSHAACISTFRLVEEGAPLPTTVELKNRAKNLVQSEIACRKGPNQCGSSFEEEIRNALFGAYDSFLAELISGGDSESRDLSIDQVVPDTTTPTEAKKRLENLLIRGTCINENEESETFTIVDCGNQDPHVGSLLDNLDKACQSAQQVNAALSTINNQSQQTPATARTIVIPDPRLEYYVSRNATFGDGRQIDPTKPNRERQRLLVADQFERMARIFMAGTDQLARDLPHKDGIAGHTKQFPAPIYGMYQGYQPDLVYTDSINKVMQGPMDGAWGACGVVNTRNGLNRFKSKSGNYLNESIVGNTIRSYVAQPGVNGAPQDCESATRRQHRDYYTGRGKIIDKMFTIMQRIVSDIKVAGHIHSASHYGGIDTACDKMWGELRAYRTDLYGDAAAGIPGVINDVANGLPRPVTSLQCVAAEEKTAADQVNDMNIQNKVIHRNQERACHLAAMQAQIEVRMMTQYAYCVWRSAGSNQMDIIMRALVSKNDAVPVDQPLECASPSGFALLFGLFAALSRSRRSKRALRGMLMSVCVVLCLANAACNPDTTTGYCGAGFGASSGYDNGRARLDFMALETGNPYHPREGWGAQTRRSDGMKCIGGRCGTSNFSSFLSANNIPSSARLVPMCEYKCKGLRTRVDEYKKKTQAAIDSGRLSTDKVAEARQRIIEQEDLYAKAMSDCGRTTLTVYKEGWNRRTMRESAEKGQAACLCSETGLGFAEVLPDGPGEGYEEAKRDGERRGGGPNQGTGGVGSDAPPDNGGTVLNGGNPEQLASIAGGGGSSTRTTSVERDAGRTRAGATAGAEGTAGVSPFRASNGLDEGNGNNNGTAPGVGGLGGLSGFGNGAGAGQGLQAAAGANGSANGSDGSGAYGEPGGAGGRGGTPDAGAYGRGLAGSGGAGTINPGGDGENTVMNFNESNATGEDAVSAMGSTDPEDYFSRIGLDESIFKKVERRYNQKATAWALMPISPQGSARRPASSDIPLLHPDDLNPSIR